MEKKNKIKSVKRGFWKSLWKIIKESSDKSSSGCGPGCGCQAEKRSDDNSRNGA